MPLSDERMQILRMLKADKLSVEEAARLLEALDKGSREPLNEVSSIVIKVTEAGRDRANINIPVELAKVALRFVPKDVLDSHEVDIDGVIRSIEAGMRGKLVEVDQPEEQRKVEIFVE